MLLYTILLYLLLVYFFLLRTLRWASIWQQKEYRLDRLWAFLQSPQGTQELVVLLHFAWKKHQVKRPRLTPKMIVVLSTYLLVLVFLLVTSNWLWLIIHYLLIPIHLIVATFPAWLITRYQLSRYEKKAISNLKKNKPVVIAIGGSYGKTTTKIILGQLLQASYSVWVSPKSHNTPLSIAKALATEYAGEGIVVMEYAAYKKGEISYLVERYPFETAVFTGLNAQHLSLFGSYQKMIEGESELYQDMGTSQSLFYNDKDDDVRKQIKNFSAKKLPASKAAISHISLDKQGKLSFRLDNQKVTTKILGTHYISNIALAVGVARHYGIKTKQIVAQLESFKPTLEFIQYKKLKSGLVVIVDDRTSNPDGFLSAIDLLTKIDAKSKIIISDGIIDLGSMSNQVHEKLAKSIDMHVDYFLHTSTIGKNQFMSKIDNKYYSITNSEQLKNFINQIDKSDSVILIEGKIKPEYQSYVLSL